MKLGNAAITLEQILNMQAGDVIGLDVPETMLAEVDGVPVLECRCGVSNGQYAVRVSRVRGAAASASSASMASGIAMNGMRVSGRTKQA